MKKVVIAVSYFSVLGLTILFQSCSDDPILPCGGDCSGSDVDTTWVDDSLSGYEDDSTFTDGDPGGWSDSTYYGGGTDGSTDSTCTGGSGGWIDSTSTGGTSTDSTVFGG